MVGAAIDSSIVGVLDAFLRTWSQARATFGEGSPQGGDGLDQSAQLRGLQSQVKAAAPKDWTGAASDTYAEANARQSRALGAMADLDQRLKAEVDRSAAVVSAGRRDLDAVSQWVVDAAAGVPATAAGERMLYPVVSKGAGEVAEIIQRSSDDLASIAGRIRKLGTEYDELSTPDSEPVDFEGDDEEKSDLPETTLDLADIVQKAPFDPNDPNTYGPPG